MHAALAWLAYLISVTWPLYWPVLAALLVLALVERRFPAEANQPYAPLLFNLAWYAVYLLIYILLSWSAWGRLFNAAAHALPGPLLPAPTGPLEFAARVLLILVVLDFLAYWAHRLQHAVPAFWAFHRMHHDERHLNASTGMRQHWLQLPFLQIVVMLPVAWLFGLDALSPAVVWIPAAVSMFQHMNVRLQMGRATPLLMGPQLHRLHHSSDARFYNSNYATILPLWDLLFGTYRAPRAGQFDPAGVAGVGPTHTVGRALFGPLADWWEMIRPPRRPVRKNLRRR
jgi:sterol desaturase/sphingolipid hydroxylase (fatty acid hydroxylase superfamily)